MSHTDSPEDDVACTACETEGSRSRLDDGGLCPDCRTPAGRLVMALSVLGIKATANKRGIVRVKDRTFVCEPGEASVPWVISDVAETLDEATTAAADAIAAIVQAPGLRAESAEYDAFILAISEAVDIPPDSEKYEASDPRDLVRAVRDVRERCDELDGALSDVFHALTVDGYSGEVIVLPDAIAALRAERDALAARVRELEAENARLTSRVETFAGALLSLGAS